MPVREEQSGSYLSDIVQKFISHKLALGGLCVLLLEILCTIFLPFIFKLDPYKSNPAAFGTAPGLGHILGTDSIGRDIFARLVYGGRTSLSVGLLSTITAMCLGTPLGLIAGYYRGWIESIVMRLADIFMSFPSMVLILVLVAVIGPSLWSVTIVIGILGWTQFARLIHSGVLSVREKEYVESARAIGSSDFVIITKYVLVNCFAPILVAATFMTASSIILESSLSFLGMGVQPPQASWGNLLYDAQSITVLSRRPWQWVPPGLMLILTVLSINFVGDGVRGALDPKIKI